MHEINNFDEFKHAFESNSPMFRSKSREAVDGRQEKTESRIFLHRRDQK